MIRISVLAALVAALPAAASAQLGSFNPPPGPQGAASTVDIAETGNFNPNAQAYFGINPHSAHVGVPRVVGITHVLSPPTGGVISGQAALINLAGSTVPQMAVVPRAAMVI